MALITIHKSFGLKQLWARWQEHRKAKKFEKKIKTILDSKKLKSAIDMKKEKDINEQPPIARG